MIRARTDGQVTAAAAQMDRALTQLEPSQLAELTAARRSWHDTGRMPPATPELVRAVSHPDAAAWDAVFVKAARRELSVPPPSVRP